MKKIHIVSFDVPFPADYGGVIDVYYKLKALKEAGIGIILHTFSYNRKEAKELNELCEEVHYYTRKTGWSSILRFTPYIVKSRMSKEMLRNLAGDDHPVLFEGLHCCGYIGHSKLRKKIKIYRESNIEHQYYRGLASATRSIKKKIFFLSEAIKLKRFQQKLRHADLILPVSTTDQRYLQKKFPTKKIDYLPSFHGMNYPDPLNGKGEFVLFQGNLSVPENEEAALWLVKKVFSKIPVKSVIAGKNPGKKLKKEIVKNPLIALVPNPDDGEMERLIREAQANVLITLRPAGLKLKLVNGLYKGRYCIANHHMLKGTPLKDTCIPANTSQEIRNAITDVRDKSWTDVDTVIRAEVLRPFNDVDKAEKLIKLIWPEAHQPVTEH